MNESKLDRAPLAPNPKIERICVSAYQVPTDGPDGEEADGTLSWSSTTLVLVEIEAGGKSGLGYSYGDVSAAHLIASKLSRVIQGQRVCATGSLWGKQEAKLRNNGRSGIGALGLSAVDIALWDLKAKLLCVPLFQLLGAYRPGVEIYGSGGFCNYSLERLVSQVAGWVEQGIGRVKIKTSRSPEQDPERLAACRRHIGPDTALMTDANGALSRKQALDWAERFHGEWNVVWFEEPVSSEDREGLRLIRDRGPAGLEVTAGEYGFVLRDFADWIEAGSVDCMQADVTRCGGITGLLEVGGLCRAHQLDLSAHCAPAVSMHAFCAVEKARHLEYFHDHVRVEQLLFDGVVQPQDGVLYPDPARPGLGIELKRQDAERHLIYRSD